MLGFSWKQWVHGFTGYSRWWCRTSWADRCELMLAARYGFDDALMVLYTLGEYDPQSRHLALQVLSGNGHYNWCWPERILAICESVLRMYDATVVLFTAASLNPDLEFMFVFSDTYEWIKERQRQWQTRKANRGWLF